MKKALFFSAFAAILFSSCATILGGKITDCQRITPKPGEPQRKIRKGALAADIIFFWPAALVDFATCAIYKPYTINHISDYVEKPKITAKEPEIIKKMTPKMFLNIFDSVKFKKHIIKTSPISYLLEPTVFYDHHLGKGVYASIKLGHKIGKDNSQSDQDQGKGILYQYYSGPLLGIGLRFPSFLTPIYISKKLEKRMEFIDLELIYKKMSVDKVNLATSGFTGELRDYERLAGVTDGFTAKILYVKQYWQKGLLFELFGGVGLKWRMNNKLYKIGYGDSNGNGYITYHGYKDYEDYKKNYDPNFYFVDNIGDQLIPTIHFGFNVGLGW